MGNRISKRIRTEAILICAVAASNPRFNGIPYYLVAEELDIAGIPVWVATSAHLACFGGARARMAEDVESDVEAAQLLTDGWSPGDPVEQLT